MANADNRTLHTALAASVALHALLLLSLPDLVDGARRAAAIPPQIIARLMEPAPAPVPEPAPAPPPPAPPVQPPEKPAAKKPIPKPKPKLTVPTPAPAPAPPVVESPAVPAPPPPVAKAAPQPDAPPQPVPAPQAAAPAQPLDSLSRDQYRLLLIEEANRHKRYPPIARENNWEGRSHVVVAVAPDGRTSVTLKQSSGHEVLDRLAISMFTQAAREVPVPPALRGKQVVLDLPIRFELEN